MGDDEDGPSRALVALLQPLCSDAWVQCDHCELWRRVPKEVSERLGDDEQWCAPPSLLRTHRLVPADAVRRFPAVRRAFRARADGGPPSVLPPDPSRSARIAAIEAPRRVLAARAPRALPGRHHDRAPTRAISVPSLSASSSRANAKPQNSKTPRLSPQVLQAEQRLAVRHVRGSAGDRQRRDRHPAQGTAGC